MASPSSLPDLGLTGELRRKLPSGIGLFAGDMPAICLIVLPGIPSGLKKRLAFLLAVSAHTNGLTTISPAMPLKSLPLREASDRSWLNAVAAI